MFTIEFRAVHRFSLRRLWQFIVRNRMVPLGLISLLTTVFTSSLRSDRALKEFDRFKLFSEKNESVRLGSLHDGHSHDRLVLVVNFPYSLGVIGGLSHFMCTQLSH